MYKHIPVPIPTPPTHAGTSHPHDANRASRSRPRSLLSYMRPALSSPPVASVAPDRHERSEEQEGSRRDVEAVGGDLPSSRTRARLAAAQRAPLPDVYRVLNRNSGSHVAESPM